MSNRLLGPVSPPQTGMVKLAEATASSDSTIDFTTAPAFDGTYRNLMIVGNNITPTTDGADFNLRLSVSSTFQTGASDYLWLAGYATGSATDGALADLADSRIQINDNTGSAANEDSSFSLYIGDPNAAKYTDIWGMNRNVSLTPTHSVTHFGGTLLQASAVDGVRFYYTSGSIESGEFTMYGYT